MLALTMLVTSACSKGGGEFVASPISPSSSVEPTELSATAAPDPSPTATPTPAKSSAAPAKPRTGKPGADNTGVPPGTALTVVTGDQTFSTPGQVITGKDFHGFVKVTAANVTIRKSVFRGRATSNNAALLDTRKATNFVVEDSEIVASNPSAGIDGAWLRNTSMHRVNIHGVTDGVKAESNVLIQDSYIHDMKWFASDPNQGGGPTHNDGVQSFEGDSGIVLRHNNIDLSSDSRANAAWQTSASDSRVEDNWLDGGGCTLNFAHRDGVPLTGNRVVNNRFGRKSKFDCPILISTKTVLAQNSGNVWADTGKPIPPVEQHD